MEVFCNIVSSIRKYRIRVDFFLFFFVPIFCIGQNLDSLKNVIYLGRITDSKDILENYYLLGKNYMYVDVDTSFKFIQLGLNKCEANLDKNYKIKFLYLKAVNFVNKGQFDSSVKCIEEAIHCRSDNPRDSILCKLVIYKGHINFYKGSYEDAIIQYRIALQIAEDCNVLFMQGVALESIGNSLQYLSNFSEAIEYNWKAIRIYDTLNRIPEMGTPFNNIATIYYTQKEHRKAMDYYRKASELELKAGNLINSLQSKLNYANCYADLNLKDSAILLINEVLISLEELENMDLFIKASTSIGLEYILLNKIKEGEIHLNNAEKALENWNDNLLLADLYSKKGYLYGLTKKSTLSLRYFNLSISIFKNLKNKEGEIIARRMLLKSLENLKLFNLMPPQYDTISILSEELYNIAKFSALQELETKYETEKKECIITQQNLEIKNKNMGLGLVGGGLLGAIGLATLLYRKRRQEQELNQLLDQQNRVLQDANQGLLHQLSIQRESDEVAQEPLMITLSNGSQSTVNIDDIQYFEAENNIVKIVLADGTVRHDYQRLKNFYGVVKRQCNVYPNT